MTGALVPGRALWRHGVHPRPPRKTSSSHSPGAPPGRCRGRAFYSAWRACARNVPKTHRSKPRDSCHRIHFNARVLRRCFVGQHSSLKSLSRSPWLSRGGENKDQRSCRVTVGSRRALTTPPPHRERLGFHICLSLATSVTFHLAVRVPPWTAEVPRQSHVIDNRPSDLARVRILSQTSSTGATNVGEPLAFCVLVNGKTKYVTPPQTKSVPQRRDGPPPAETRPANTP